MPAADDFCSLCGQALKGQKFIRDREGELYCSACYAQKKKVQASQRALAEKQSADSTATATAAAPAMAAAPMMPVMVPIPGLPMPEPEVVSHSTDEEEPPARFTTSAMILALSFVVMASLHYAVPEEGGITPAKAVIAGLIQMLTVAVGAISLIVSMMITLRITGGSSPGRLDHVLAKSLGLVLAISIGEFFCARSESLWMIGFGFRGLVILTALVLLFELDFLDTIILTLINSAIGWMVTFTLAAALFAFASITPSLNPETLVDESPTQQAMPADHGSTFELNLD